IHGPQPGYNKEIFTMTPYTVAPRFFEFALDNGETDTREFLKNHDQIGPVTMIPRMGKVKNDLSAFLSRWNNGEREIAVDYYRTMKKRDCKVISSEEMSEVSALWANRMCSVLIGRGLTADAAQLAARYGIVTPVSLVLVQSYTQVSEIAADGDTQAVTEG